MVVRHAVRRVTIKTIRNGSSDDIIDRSSVAIGSRNVFAVRTVKAHDNAEFRIVMEVTDPGRVTE